MDQVAELLAECEAKESTHQAAIEEAQRQIEETRRLKEAAALVRGAIRSRWPTLPEPEPEPEPEPATNGSALKGLRGAAAQSSGTRLWASPRNPAAP